jgi:hypothetical protein
MPSWSQRLFALAFLALSLCVSTPARAEGKWLEWHESSSDLKVSVAEDGTAQIERQVKVRVVAGPIRSLELGTIDRGIVPAPTVDLATESGDSLGAHVEVGATSATPKAPELAPLAEPKPSDVPEEPLRVVVDQPDKGLRRGSYRVTLRYGVDLVATHRLTRDKSLFRLAFKNPISPEGHDASRCIFELPAAPTEPHLADLGSTMVAALERLPTVDRLSLTRAHIGKGEAVTWEIKVDPRALPKATSPELRPPPPPPGKGGEEKSPVKVAMFAVAAVCALFVGILARRREDACGVHTLPIVPAPAFVRLYVAPLFVLGGAMLACFEQPAAGTLLFALATVLLSERTARTRSRARGPGKWVTLGREPRMSPSRIRGARLTLGVYAAVVALGYAVAERVLGGLALVVPLTALVPLPMLLLAAFRADSFQVQAEELLCMIAKRTPSLGLEPSLTGRIPEGTAEPDELRLSVEPSEPLPGLLSIEVAIAEYAHLTGTAALPEVWVRVMEGTHAHAKLQQRSAAFLPGRRQGERVQRLVPDGLSVDSTVRLLSSLTTHLHDQRHAAIRVKDDRRTERRAPPSPVADKAMPVLQPT